MNLVPGTTRRSDATVKQALTVATQLVAQLKIEGSHVERREAIDNVLRILEVGCTTGFSLGNLTVEPGTKLDARLVMDAVSQINRQSTPALRLVRSNVTPPKAALAAAPSPAVRWCLTSTITW